MPDELLKIAINIIYSVILLNDTGEYKFCLLKKPGLIDLPRKPPFEGLAAEAAYNQLALRMPAFQPDPEK